ncbi:MAG: helix-turn-helix transcriptional regulator [Clostridia bacterium]|nr:helix-turn-helix transcriptional regulator [Clostridia bacterium]
MSMQKTVGEKIRLYRKQKGMSIEELAARIYKSKSILSKYELGESVFDMETLYNIAEALDIEPAQLFEPRKMNAAQGGDRYGIFTANKLYAYILVREKNYKLIKSMLVFHGDEADSATLYMQVPDFERYTDCQVLYSGQLFCYPGNAVIQLTNQADSSDHASLYAAIRMGGSNYCIGMIILSGYSTHDPGALKILLTRRPVEDEQILENVLTITRDDQSQTKRTNIFCYKISAIDEKLFP